ncbi:MAG: GAF domain-containing protein [bacterium]|nr:GAF domain-containing protein [bacterium]
MKKIEETAKAVARACGNESDTPGAAGEKGEQPECFARDGAACKSVGEAFWKSEENLRITLNSIGDGVIATDTEGAVTGMNPVAETLTGWSFSEAEYKALDQVFNIVDSRTNKPAVNPVTKVLESGRIVRLANHTMLMAKGGTRYNIADSAAPIKNAAGAITGVVLVFRDVTEEYGVREELRKSRERLDLAMSVANDGMWDWNLETDAVYFDSHCYTMAGYEANEFPASFEEWRKRVHPGDIPQTEAAVKAYLEGKTETYTADFRFLRKDGTWVWIQAKGKIVEHDESGSPVRFVGSHSDITKSKRTEEQLRLNESRLEALVTLGEMASCKLQEIADFALEEGVRLTGSSIGYLAFMNDDETELIMHSWSKTAMRKCGIIDKPIVYQVADTGLWGEAVRQRKPVITNDYAAPNPLKRGHPEGHVEVTRHMNIPVSDDGKIVVVAGVGNKIAEYDQSDVRQLTLLMQGMWRLVQRKQAEEKLSEYRVHLELLVKERTAELEKQKEKAESANKAKSEFLANMSHELRTPLNAVIGFSELLSGILNDSREKGYVHSIKVAGKNLLTLINDILDMSKIEAGMLAIKPTIVNIKTVIHEIEEIFGKRMEEKNMGFIIDIDKNMPGVLVLDEVRIRQILLNLVGNAEKFTEKGFIKISVKKLSANEEGSKINLGIVVEDSGIGIPAKSIDEIFEAFKQREGLDTKKYGGTGLGLSICKKLVKAMRGEISVQSTPGKGTVFEIFLKNVPVAAYDRTVIGTESATQLENIHFEKGTILVVDDIESNLDVMREMLEKIGFSVLMGSNGKIALDLIRGNRPDLVFMDIKMPVLDGKQATREIKADPETHSIPVVALTASSSRENQNSFMENDFDGFLSKPFAVEDLLAILSRYFKLSGFKPLPAVAEHSMENIDFNVIEEPGKLIEILKREILPVGRLIKDVMIMDRVETFGERLKTLADTHRVESFRNFGVNFKTLAENFDIVAIENEVDELAEGIEQLLKRWEATHGN